MSRRLLDRAVDHFGSEEKLGLAIGYSQHGIHRARRAGSATPQMAYAIHVATKGLFDYRKLCPALDCEAQLKLAHARLETARARVVAARARTKEQRRRKANGGRR